MAPKEPEPDESLMAMFACHCLNVQLTGVPVVDAGRQHFDQHHHLSDQFLRDSQLIRVRRSNGIKINYEYLCLKRPLIGVGDSGDNAAAGGRNGTDSQIIFCAVCEKETHTILPMPTSKNGTGEKEDDDMKSSSWLMVAAHSTLLCDPAKIAALRCVPNYSQALGIVLPIVDEIGSRDTDFLVPSYIQLDVQDKIKTYLQQEKFAMQERIRQFTQEQECHYKDLWQATQESKNRFLRIIETIKLRNSIDDVAVAAVAADVAATGAGAVDDEFFQDKENRAANVTAVPNNNNYVMYPGRNHHLVDGTGENILADENLGSGKNSAVAADSDECLFDIDDIDIQTAVAERPISSGYFESETLILDQNQDQDDQNEDDDGDDDDFDLQEQLVPLKESMINSQQQQQQKSMSYSMSSGAMAIHREHRKSTGGRKDGGGGRPRQVANSLPIQIPHNLNRNDRHMEESFQLNPGESIADSILKMARSVRNETDILDDRPRRRLNTGDLIRPFFNN